MAKSTGRALLEDYSVKNTQPHFYEEHLQKSDKAVNLLDIVGKPIELAADLRGKGEDKTPPPKSLAGATTTTTPSSEDVEELTSPVVAMTGDGAKLELCDEVTKDLTPTEAPSKEADVGARGNDRRCRAQRPSETCLEPEY